MTEPWAAAALGLLGAIFGSFIAVIAVRAPQRRSATQGRSACDACAAPLRAVELIPLVSFVALRGRCRHCRAPILRRHPAIELAGLAIGVAAGLAAPGWAAVSGAVFGWLLLALAAIDLAVLRLPNGLTATLALAGLALMPIDGGPALGERIIGGAAGFGVLWAVAAAYRHLRGQDGLGGGDPKLMGAIGLWLGWRALPQVLLLACGIGLFAVLVLHLRGKTVGRTEQLPFGAFLAPAAFALWLLGRTGI